MSEAVSEFFALLATKPVDVVTPENPEESVPASFNAEPTPDFIPVKKDSTQTAKKASPASSPPKPKKSRLLRINELMALPDPKWLVEDVLPDESFAVLFGQPGSGKSFAALSLALAVASGQNWLGKKTSKSQVLYIAAEGLLGFKQRVPAYAKIYPFVEDPDFFFLGGSFNFISPDSLSELQEAYDTHNLQPKLIIIDTLARTFGGGDENSSKDMGLFISVVDGVRAASNAAVLLIHHTGKANSNERGSSALRGAADVMVHCDGGTEANKENQPVKLTCEKMKDAEPFKEFCFVLTKVDLPNGGSSLVPEFTTDQFFRQEAEANQKIALEALKSFGDFGARNKDWLDKFSELSGKSKPTFERTRKILFHSPEVSYDTTRKIYRYVGDSSVSVSGKCQTGVTKPEDSGVTSPPFKGDDTDTTPIGTGNGGQD